MKKEEFYKTTKTCCIQSNRMLNEEHFDSADKGQFESTEDAINRVTDKLAQLHITVAKKELEL